MLPLRVPVCLYSPVNQKYLTYPKSGKAKTLVDLVTQTTLCGYLDTHGGGEPGHKRHHNMNRLGCQLHYDLTDSCKICFGGIRISKRTSAIVLCTLILSYLLAMRAIEPEARHSKEWSALTAV